LREVAVVGVRVLSVGFTHSGNTSPTNELLL